MGWLARAAWLIPVLLSGWALTTLLSTSTGLRIDVSTDRLQSTAPPPEKQRLVIGWFASDPIGQPQLAAIAATAARMRAIPGVDAVRLPTDVPGGPASESAHALADHPLLRGQLISPPGTAVLGWVDASPGADIPKLAATLRQAAAVETLDLEITAPALLDQARTEVIQRGLQRLIIGGAIGFLILMLLIWRNLRAAVGILLTVAASLLWTLAAQQWLGIPLDMVTLIAPGLTATLSLAYAMHLIASTAHTQALNGAVAAVAQPILMTAATTIAGLLALALSPAPAIRDFALLASLGAGFAAIATLSVLPLVLRTRSRRPHWRSGWSALLQPVLRLAGRVTRRNSTRLLIAWGLALVLLAVGASRVTHALDPLRGLPSEHPARLSFDRLNQAAGGLQFLRIEIRLDRPQAWTEARPHQALIRLEDALESLNRTGSVLSHLDHARAAQRWFGQDPSNLPSGPGLAQLLVFGTGDALYDTIDRRFQVAQLHLSSPITGSDDTAELLAAIQSSLAPFQASIPTATITVHGALQRLHDSAGDLATGQRQSLLLALAAMWLLLSLLFASPRAGLWLLLPNTVPLIAFFGLLGWAELQLGPVTGLAACVVLGIAVDDTLHYFARYHALARRRAEERSAAIEALEHTLLPITLTTLALMVGFVSLTATALEAHVQFGLLCALALLVAWACDVFLTPLLAARIRFVTLWDTLRLDLGREPQQQIPLLAGLSKRQARTFALLTELQERPAGDVIMQAGQHSDDCFVVIDGELAVTRDRADRAWHVATLGRGALVGEVGLFQQARTATVVAQTPVRLIRFSTHDLQQLVRQAPRIAAVVLFNLNTIQAERRSHDSREYLGLTPIG